jgi:hypothetical protein
VICRESPNWTIFAEDGCGTRAEAFQLAAPLRVDTEQSVIPAMLSHRGSFLLFCTGVCGAAAIAAAVCS